MNVEILHLLEGAKKARGLTVIIDVFRAFSLECYLYAGKAAQIIPVGDIKEAYELKRRHNAYILVGERNGKKCEGFDFGNSPSAVQNICLAGKTVIHTTSAGTQGIANAALADEIITGSLVNARAVAEYILRRQPRQVSLVCMGNGGVRLAAEDELCAEYIKSLLDGRELPGIEELARALQTNGGEHFFDPKRQEIYPEEDFWLCVKCNLFPFVIQVRRDGPSLATKMIPAG